MAICDRWRDTHSTHERRGFYAQQIKSIRRKNRIIVWVFAFDVVIVASGQQKGLLIVSLGGGPLAFTISLPHTRTLTHTRHVTHRGDQKGVTP